jgi:hypothetical protein
VNNGSNNSCTRSALLASFNPRISFSKHSGILRKNGGVSRRQMADMIRGQGMFLSLNPAWPDLGKRRTVIPFG